MGYHSKGKQSSNVQQEGSKKGSSKGANECDDERFDTSKPQFRKPKVKDTKVELDDRFKSVLTEPKFHLLEASVDKYGRNIPKKKKLLAKKHVKEEFGEFYTVKDESEENQNNSSVEDRFTNGDEVKQGTIRTSKKQRENNEIDKNDPVSRIAYLTALSRGEVELSSSEDDNDDNQHEFIGGSDDDSNNSINDEPLILGSEEVGVLDPSFNDAVAVDYTNLPSPYIAVMNADWTHFRAVDIFAIISSFVPAGAIRHVCVYPSNFGIERLKKEELFGPVDVWKSKNDDYTDNNSSPTEHDEEDNVKDTSNDFGSTDDINSDFDPEKLRQYEASRLKYYFAIVEFIKPEFAEIAYNEVDGMEFEHSSAALDIRVIPVDEIDSVIENRHVRDEAFSVPNSYNPPDFVVSALQQSAVECTWDAGDRNRETLLTKYNLSAQTWGQVSEADDVNAYLASDHSSDEEHSVQANKKSTRLRSMLGLDSEDDEDNGSDADEINSISDASSQLRDSGKYTMQATYVPGQWNKTARDDNIEKKDKELTPWEKFQEKRQQKKREKRAAAREKRKQANEERKNCKHRVKDTDRNDDFFVEQHGGIINTEIKSLIHTDEDDFVSQYAKESKNSEELDFDIRIVQRLEKNKDKKLTGARKRKEERLTENVVGTDFQLDTSDKRFKAVLEGSDERFGIDRTDPNFKETPSMKIILSEQTRHRSQKRKVSIVDNTNSSLPDSESLSALVTRIKQKVTR